MLFFRSRLFIAMIHLASHHLAYTTELSEYKNLTECGLPSVCQVQRVNILIDASGREKMTSKVSTGLRCDIVEGFFFRFHNNQCLFKAREFIIELRWPNSNTHDLIFDAKLNASNLFEVISPNLYDKEFSLNLVNIKGFGCNINDMKILTNWSIKKILLTNCKFEFYDKNHKRMNTCGDFIESNVTSIQSIFQMYKVSYKFYYDPYYFSYQIYYYKDYLNVTIINADFKQPLCPLVFNNSGIHMLQIIGLVDSFYKKNVLSFSNYTFKGLTTIIQRLELDKVQNINLDFNLLNPDVFNYIRTIDIFGSINRIEESIFPTFKSLFMISFKTNYFRKMMHINGINWIKAINSHISVDVLNQTVLSYYYESIKLINLDCNFYSQEERLATVFPDEDFCLYAEFPFTQIVTIAQHCGRDVYEFNTNIDFSCTFFWLSQHFNEYGRFFYNYQKYLIYDYLYYDYFKDRIDFLDEFITNFLRFSDNSTYKLMLSRCNFTHMKRLCDKNSYSVSDIWGLYDYSILNKKFEIGFKISSYVVSLLGIITNLIVVITIIHKSNNDLFKEFKQYIYLYYNSIFSILILSIQLLSWMSECFYPYEVFCPEIRKLVFIQLFKMVFKECFITAFRFMCNFSYVAFSLNRISLIGKDHGKLVQFISQVGVKTYLTVCFIMSCGFSVVKYFKYEINYDQPETSYPISNEHDLSSIHRTHISNDGVIIANSIFDVLNYIVFEVITFIIDIYMLVLLKRTLDEKLRKSEKLFGKNEQSKLENMKKENEDAINKVIKMVVLNTAISLLFRLPIAFIPVVNIFAEFYYKNYLNQFKHPKFGEFYSFLLDSGFYDFILECSDLFFTLSLFIQLFMYSHFDKKFNIAVGRLFCKDSNTSDPNKEKRKKY